MQWLFVQSAELGECMPRGLLPALLVTFALQICQVAFVNYLPRFLNYNAVYGTIGLLMLLLTWVYLTGILIIAGACLCAAWRSDEFTPTSVPST